MAVCVSVAVAEAPASLLGISRGERFLFPAADWRKFNCEGGVVAIVSWFRFPEVVMVLVVVIRLKGRFAAVGDTCKDSGGVLPSAVVIPAGEPTGAGLGGGGC